jgi:hypothetical protein
MYPDVRGSPTGWSTQTGTGSGVQESQSGCFLYRCASLQQGTRRSRDHQNRDTDPAPKFELVCCNANELGMSLKRRRISGDVCFIDFFVDTGEAKQQARDKLRVYGVQPSSTKKLAPRFWMVRAGSGRVTSSLRNGTVELHSCPCRKGSKCAFPDFRADHVCTRPACSTSNIWTEWGSL